MFVAIVATVLVGIFGAGPAVADPARPTDVRSTVLAVAPPGAPLTAAVVGGDSFLEMTVVPGHEVVVSGYENEPFLWVKADGTVEENTQSPAHYLNRDRYATTKVPDTVKAKNPPQWVPVGSGHRALWHDHRIHFMGRTGQLQDVQPWSVPLTIDGTAGHIDGTQIPMRAPSALPWFLAIGAVGLLPIVAGRGRTWLIALAILAASVPAALIANALAFHTPAAATRDRVDLALVALAAGTSLLALLATHWRAVAGSFLAGSGLAILLWSVRRVNVLSRAILVTDLADWVDRLAVSASIGAGLAGLAIGAWAVSRPGGRN